jgi:hypothetical protein
MSRAHESQKVSLVSRLADDIKTGAIEQARDTFSEQDVVIR